MIYTWCHTLKNKKVMVNIMLQNTKACMYKAMYKAMMLQFYGKSYRN